MFETNLSSNIDPHILRQMSENYQNNQLKNEIAQTNNAEYMAKVIGQRIVDFQSTRCCFTNNSIQQFNYPLCNKGVPSGVGADCISRIGQCKQSVRNCSAYKSDKCVNGDCFKTC